MAWNLHSGSQPCGIIRSSRHAGDATMQRILYWVTVLALLAGAAPASAQQPYPSRPITLIVPYAAGGSVDVVARVVANALGRKLGQNVVDRKRGRRRRRHRHAARRARRAGRLHAAVLGREHDGDREAGVAARRPIRQPEGFRADHDDRDLAAGAGRQQGPARQHHCRTDEAAAGQPGQVQLRKLRCRHLAACRRRDDQHRRQGEDGARALPGRLPDRRPT